MTARAYDQESHGFGQGGNDALPVVAPCRWTGTAWALADASDATHVIVDSAEDTLWVASAGHHDRRDAGNASRTLHLAQGVWYPHASTAGGWQRTDPGNARLEVEVLDALHIIVRPTSERNKNSAQASEQVVSAEPQGGTTKSGSSVAMPLLSGVVIAAAWPARPAYDLAGLVGASRTWTGVWHVLVPALFDAARNTLKVRVIARRSVASQVADTVLAALYKDAAGSNLVSASAAALGATFAALDFNVTTTGLVVGDALYIDVDLLQDNTAGVGSPLAHIAAVQLVVG